MKQSSLINTGIAVSREIDSEYDNVKIVADDIAHVIAVATAIGDGTFNNVDVVILDPLKGNINALGPIAADIATVASISADIQAIALDGADIGLVAGSITSINTVATNISRISTVYNNIATITAVANNAANINTVAGMDSNIQLVLDAEGNVNIVADNIVNVNNVGNNIADITYVSDSMGHVLVAAHEIDNIIAVSNNSANITNVASSITAINAVNSEPLKSAILDAEGNSTSAALRAWEAEAKKRTADSYATEPEDVFVKIWSSNGDGTYSYVDSTDYSALHHSIKAFDASGADMAKATYDTTDNGIVDNSEKLIDFNKHGVVSGGMLATVDGVDTDLINISAGTYYINGTEYQYAGGSYDTAALFGAGDFGTLGINSSGAIVPKVNDFFDELELDTVLEICAFAKFTATTVDVIDDSKFYTNHFIKDMLIRAKAFEGTYFNGTAGVVTENLTNTGQLDIGQGYINTPNGEVKLITAGSDIGGATIYNVAGTYEIQPQSPFVVSDTQYDDGTGLAVIPNNKWVTHTVARSSRTGTVYLIYGKTVYNSLGDAQQAGYDLGAFATNESTSEVEPLANVVVQQAAGIVATVDLRNRASGITSSVLSNLSLQTAYDLSGVPEIQLATGKVLEVRNDVGDTNSVIQKWTDSTGTSIAEIGPNGLQVNADIIQNGVAYETHAEQVYTTKDEIILRDGAVAGLTGGQFTGLRAKLYDGVNDGLLQFDNTGVARVGDEGSTQALATREDNPVDTGVVTWDNATSKFVTNRDINVDNVTVSGTVDGRDVSVDGIKLDSIEVGAEVNNISDINATDLTDGLDSSLHYHASDRNRSNHSGTQTASTISDFDIEVTNNVTVAANTADRHNHANKLVLDNITASYTVEEEIKLVGIESGATADQTGAEIKALYEAELDTNAFTDLEKTKLAGIEDGATGDQTAAEIKSLYESNTNTNEFTDTEKTKLGYLLVTSSVDLDQIGTEADFVAALI